MKVVTWILISNETWRSGTHHLKMMNPGCYLLVVKTRRSQWGQTGSKQTHIYSGCIHIFYTWYLHPLTDSCVPKSLPLISEDCTVVVFPRFEYLASLFDIWIASVSDRWAISAILPVSPLEHRILLGGSVVWFSGLNALPCARSCRQSAVNSRIRSQPV